MTDIDLLRSAKCKQALEIAGTATWQDNGVSLWLGQEGGRQTFTIAQYSTPDKPSEDDIWTQRITDHEALCIVERHLTEHLEQRHRALYTACQRDRKLYTVYDADKTLAQGPTRFAAKTEAVLAIGKEKSDGPPN